jgi:hypothetical protein
MATDVLSSSGGIVCLRGFAIPGFPYPGWSVS